jgi:hypothetical protein
VPFHWIILLRKREQNNTDVIIFMYLYFFAISFSQFITIIFRNHKTFPQRIRKSSHHQKHTIFLFIYAFFLFCFFLLFFFSFLLTIRAHWTNKQRTENISGNFIIFSFAPYKICITFFYLYFMKIWFYLHITT